MEIKLG